MLDEERTALNRERRRLMRDAGEDGSGVSENMLDEVFELLDLFGLPYVVAPMEAEAQCAELEILGVVDGTITDDSDSWLFGSKMVFKNFFQSQRFLEVFKISDIGAELGLGREELICMALLLGSDYTKGIKGVGIVNALEIIQAFPGESGLRDFARWLNYQEDLVSATGGSAVREGAATAAARLSSVEVNVEGG